MNIIKTKYTIGVCFNKAQDTYISLCICNPVSIRVILGNNRLFIRLWLFEISIDPFYTNRTLNADDPWGKRKGFPFKRNIIDIDYKPFRPGILKNEKI
jgi:hypothetical protein